MTQILTKCKEIANIQKLKIPWSQGKNETYELRTKDKELSSGALIQKSMGPVANFL